MREVIIEKAGFMTKSERSYHLWLYWWNRGGTSFDEIEDVTNFTKIGFDIFSYHRLKKLGWCLNTRGELQYE